MVFAAAEELGNVPRVILGDLNVELSLSMVTSMEISSGRWADAAATWADATGTDVAPTCFARRYSPGTRRDYVVLNAVAAPALVGHTVLNEAGFATHRPVEVQLLLAAYAQKVRMLRVPRRLPTIWQLSNDQEENLRATEVFQAVFSRWEHRWWRHIDSKDVEGLWTIWCACAEDYLLKRSSMPEAAVNKGRGQARYEWKRHTAGSNGDEGAINAHIRRLLKLRRRVEELCRKWAAAPQTRIGQEPSEWFQLWNNARAEGA